MVSVVARSVGGSTVQAAGIGLVALLLAVAPLRSARACAPAPHAGESVRIFEEEALIVWDAKTKTQHFIRRAAFDTQANDFGFLVPTPEKPELAEASDDVFRRLAQAIAPAVEWKVEHPLELGSWLFGMMLRSAKSETAIAASVEVLSVARVAGYDAVVLQADDAKALADWLDKHDYEMGQDLTDWLEPYVKAKWKITAFKIAKDESGRTLPELGTQAVRMSFHAERPFFPYREPKSQRTVQAASLDPLGPRDRKLRVYVLSPGRVEGKLETPGGFPGKVVYARPQSNAEPLLAGVLPQERIPNGLWLTAFEDKSSPRPGVADVTFEKASDSTEVVPPPFGAPARSRSSYPWSWWYRSPRGCSWWLSCCSVTGTAPRAEAVRGVAAPDQQKKKSDSGPEAAQAHGAPHSALGQGLRGLARDGAPTQGFIQHLAGVGFDLLFNASERSCLGSAVVLHGRADHAAGIGDEVRHHQHAALGQELLGFEGDRDVGAGDHQLGRQLTYVVLADDVGARGGHPHVAVDSHDGVAGQRLGGGKHAHAAGLALEGDEGLHVDAVRCDHRRLGIAGGDQRGAPLGQEAGGVSAYGTEALDRHARAAEVHTGVLLRHAGADREPEARGTELVEGDASELPGQADGATDLVVRPCHTLFISAHVRAHDVVAFVFNGASERADQPLLLGSIRFGIGCDYRLATTVR